jgi:hypothetical protein
MNLKKKIDDFKAEITKLIDTADVQLVMQIKFHYLLNLKSKWRLG